MAGNRRKKADSPFDCYTSTVTTPSVSPRTFSICCLGNFPFPFSYTATLGSQHGPDLYTISSSDSSWENLQWLHEEVKYYPDLVGKVLSWFMWQSERQLLIVNPRGSWIFHQDLCKAYAKPMQKKKSHVSVLFLNIRLMLRRYKIQPKKQCSGADMQVLV